MEKENHKISVREILKVTKGELVTGNEMSIKHLNK